LEYNFVVGLVCSWKIVWLCNLYLAVWSGDVLFISASEFRVGQWKCKISWFFCFSSSRSSLWSFLIWSVLLWNAICVPRICFSLLVSEWNLTQYLGLHIIMHGTWSSLLHFQFQPDIYMHLLDLVECFESVCSLVQIKELSSVTWIPFRKTVVILVEVAERGLLELLKSRLRHLTHKVILFRLRRMWVWSAFWKT